MTPAKFDALCEEFINREIQLLAWKRGEYTSGGDRLFNFRQVAEFLGQRPSEVALAYLLKHVQSITLAVRSGKLRWCWETVEGEGLKQRIADARNYLLLLAGCLEEESEVKNEQMSVVYAHEGCTKE